MIVKVTEKASGGYYYLPLAPYSNEKIVNKIQKNGKCYYNNFDIENPAVQIYNQGADYSNAPITIKDINTEYASKYSTENNVLKNGVSTSSVRRFFTQIGTYYKVASNIPNLYTIPRWTEHPKSIMIDTTGADKIIITSDSDNSLTLDCLKTVTSIYNLKPSTTYTYKTQKSDGTVIKTGSFTTSSGIRMIKLSGIRNIRDLGGWPTVDGKTLKYGKVFRGSMPCGDYLSSGCKTFTRGNCTETVNSTELDTMIPYLGITDQVDLRLGTTTSVLGTNYKGSEDNVHAQLHKTITLHNGKTCGAYTDVTGVSADNLFISSGKHSSATTLNAANPGTNSWERLVKCIELILQDKVIYFHCKDGHDRTATIAAILEGLCGATNDAIFKDYEASTYAVDSKYVDTGLYWNSSEGDGETWILMIAELGSFYQTEDIVTADVAKTLSSTGVNLATCIQNWFKRIYGTTGYSNVLGYTTALGVIRALKEKMVEDYEPDYTYIDDVKNLTFLSGAGYSADNNDPLSIDSTKYYTPIGYTVEHDGKAIITSNNTNCRFIVGVIRTESQKTTWNNLTSLSSNSVEFANGYFFKDLDNAVDYRCEFLSISGSTNIKTIEGIKEGDIIVAISSTRNELPDVTIRFVYLNNDVQEPILCINPDTITFEAEDSSTKEVKVISNLNWIIQD